eukprot:6876972-Lingulodinium_polyedra.AAC.1
MWALRVRDHVLIEGLLHTRLEEMRHRAELVAESELDDSHRSSLMGSIKFGYRVRQWSVRLNARYPEHSLGRA